MSVLEIAVLIVILLYVVIWVRSGLTFRQYPKYLYYKYINKPPVDPLNKWHPLILNPDFKMRSDKPETVLAVENIRFVLQTDGDLAMYVDNKKLWGTGYANPVNGDVYEAYVNEIGQLVINNVTQGTNQVTKGTVKPIGLYFLFVNSRGPSLIISDIHNKQLEAL